MAENYIKYFCLHTILFVCFGQVFPIEYVPLLVWDSVNKGISVPALQHLNKNEFVDILQERLQDKPFVIVFSEENLSTEDFSNVDSSGKSTLVALSEAIGKSNEDLTYFLSVQSPFHILKKLSTTEKQMSKSVLTARGLSSEPKPEAGHFFFIEFDDAYDNENRPHLLQRHVEFMAKTFNKIKSEYSNVLAIYTGRYPSWYSPNVESTNRVARHLLEEDDSDRNAFNDTMILFYLEGNIEVKGANNDKPLSHVSYNASHSDEEIKLLGSFENGKIEFVFIPDDGNAYWFLKNISLTITDTDTNTYDFNILDVYAPYDFSYHCSDLELTGKSTSNKEKKVQIILPNLQVQVDFKKEMGGKFGDAYDCIGFTSVPIWSGLFVTFILALIMTIGLTMMMDIKTMDRFDDPKGKTISVNVTD